MAKVLPFYDYTVVIRQAGCPLPPHQHTHTPSKQIRISPRSSYKWSGNGLAGGQGSEADTNKTKFKLFPPLSFSWSKDEGYIWGVGEEDHLKALVECFMHPAQRPTEVPEHRNILIS